MGLTEKDKDIQQSLDANRSANTKEYESEFHEYKQLYEVLESEPKLNIPDGFALRVAQLALDRKVKGATKKDYWFFAIGVAMILFFAIGGVVWAGVSLNIEGFAVVKPFLKYFLMGIGLIAIFQYLDYKIWKRRLDNL